MPTLITTLDYGINISGIPCSKKKNVANLFFSSLFSSKGCGFCPLGATIELGPAPAVLVDAILLKVIAE